MLFSINYKLTFIRITLIQAMNRSLINVILGGVGTLSQGTGQAKAIEGTATEINVENVRISFLWQLLKGLMTKYVE